MSEKQESSGCYKGIEQKFNPVPLTSADRMNNEVTEATFRVDGWKPGTADKAIEIARKLGFTAEIIQVDPERGRYIPQIAIFLKPSHEGLTNFWKQLEEEIPYYWKKEENPTAHS